MKKYVRFLLVFLLAFTLAACGSTQEAEPGGPEEIFVRRTAEILEEEPEPESDGAQTESENTEDRLSEEGTYTSKEDVSLYRHLYGHLPDKFITKKEAEKLGWSGGSLESYALGMCIGGSRFGNYEGLLPEKEGRTYTECDIDTLGADR